MKRVFIILLASLLVLCGAGAAASVTTLSVVVSDSSDGNNPVSEASVVLSGSPPSTYFTTSSGTAEFTVEYPKTYTVTVAKNGYLSETKTVEIDEANPTVSFYLSPEPPILITITDSKGSPVSGADVSINGKSAGKSDDNGRIHVSMIRGVKNTISVSAPSYVSYNEQVVVDADKTAYSVILELSKVSPLILVYSEGKDPVAGASVYVNGNLAAYTDAYGKAQLSSYTSGKYTIKVEAENFVTETISENFSEDSSTIIVDLKYASATITVKSLSDNKPVADTVIYFDGDIRGITDANGIYTTSSAPGTKVYISASHEGYSANGVTYTVVPGDDNLVIISMEQNVPVVLIGVGIFAVLVVLLIIVLVISGRRRKPVKSPPKSYAPTNKRDSF